MSIEGILIISFCSLITVISFSVCMSYCKDVKTRVQKKRLQKKIHEMVKHRIKPISDIEECSNEPKDLNDKTKNFNDKNEDFDDETYDFNYEPDDEKENNIRKSEIINNEDNV